MIKSSFMFKPALLILSIVCLSHIGCTHALHMTRVSDFEVNQPLDTYKRVEAKASQFVVMGLVRNTHYADQAFEQLLKACPEGKVTGILTRFSTSHGFFSWTNEIKMMGYCVKKP